MHVLLKYQSFDIIDKLVNCFDVLRYVLDVCHLIRSYASCVCDLLGNATWIYIQICCLLVYIVCVSRT